MKKFILLLSAIFLTLGVCTYVFKTSASNDNKYKELTFEQYKEKKQDSFFIYFHKTGCPACQELAPILNKVIVDKNKIVYAVELSKYKNEYKDYLVKNKITSVPMIIYYDKGVERKRLGNEVITEEMLKDFLSK
jgi:thiol-disulfide isomerase/thioredoxin